MFLLSYWFGMLALLGPVLGIWMRVPLSFLMVVPFLFGGTVFNTTYSTSAFDTFALLSNALLQVCPPHSSSSVS